MFRKNSYQKDYDYDAEHYVNRADRKQSALWSAALIPVFFLLLGWGIWSSYKNVMKPNRDYAVQTPSNSTNDGVTGRQLDPQDSNTDTGFQFGVGGAPVVNTPTPTMSQTQRNSSLPEEPPSTGFGFYR
jgi:hypothetical protein